MPAPPNELRGGLLPRDAEYFRGLSEDHYRGVSPLCRRLLDEMTAVRESWGDQWNQLTYEEQCRVLDQAIVDEDTVQNYYRGNLGPEYEYYPKLKLPTGQKIVCDESLSARGYTCSWRDEHSAPFSWHTRSQMDLTLDTPPMTPPNLASPAEDTRIIHGPKAVYKSRPLSLHMNKPPGFTWHYDPILNIPPDPPDLVLGATNIQKSQTLPSGSPQGGHLVIRAEEEKSGIMNRIRGAFSKLSTACFPLHICRGPQPMHTIHHAPPFNPPELRPAHVLAQASKQKKKKNSITGSEPSNSGSRASRSGRPSIDEPSSSSTPTNVHASMKSLYNYYDTKHSETYEEDSFNQNLISNSNSMYEQKVNDNDEIHLSPETDSYGSMYKNLNVYSNRHSRNSSNISHDDVSTYPTRTVTTTQSSSMISNSSRTISSHFQDSPTLTLRSSSQSIYKHDNNVNSSYSIVEENPTAINVQNNLKAHFRIHERTKPEEVTFRIKKEKDNHDEKHLISPTVSPRDATKQIVPNKNLNENYQKRATYQADVKRKGSAEEELPLVDLSTSETAIPKTGFDFLDNW